jgi:hypothetical protein
LPGPDPFLLTGDPATLALGEPYSGAEVAVLTDVPLGVAAAVGRLVAEFSAAEAGSLDEGKALHAAWTVFADAVLVGWNLHDRRGVIPADASAFARVSPRFIVAVLGSWADLMLPKET